MCQVFAPLVDERACRRVLRACYGERVAERVEKVVVPGYSVISHAAL
jgi:hypothetical protein